MTISQQINTINYAQIFKTSIRIDDFRKTIMMNSNATENFISSRLITTLKCATQKKNESYQLQIINDNSLSRKNNKEVIRETKSLSIIIQRYHEKLIFDIVKMITYDVVLRMS